MSESEWVLCEFDRQHRVTVPKAVRKFFELEYPGFLLVKIKKAEK